MKQSKLSKTKDNSYNEAIELYQKIKHRLSNYNRYYKHLNTNERDNIYNKDCKDFEKIKCYYSQKYKMPNGYFIILKTIFASEIVNIISEYFNDFH